MAAPSSGNLATLGGIVVTAGLATAANQLHGWPAWAFAVVAVVLGILTISSATFGWPISWLADDDLARLHRRTLKMCNRIKDCSEEGLRTVPHRPMSSYGNIATIAGSLKHAAEGKPASRRNRPRKLTQGTIRRLRRLIEDLGEHGLREERLERFLTTDPKPEECVTLADHLWNAAYRPQDVRGPGERPPAGNSQRGGRLIE
jgi:hypothetical protein